MDTNCNTLNNALSDEKELDCKEFSESQIGTPNHDFLPFISGELHTRMFYFIQNHLYGLDSNHNDICIDIYYDINYDDDDNNNDNYYDEDDNYYR